MRKLALALTTAVALSFAPAAQAADVITTGTATITGNSGSYDGHIVCGASAGACTFMSTISFLTPAGFNLTSAGIGSNYTGGNLLANIDFTSVTLNGVNFNIVTVGQQEFRNIFDQAMVAGATNTLVINGTAGTSAGADATFAGTLSFANVAAVPEPATWAMMLLGFGAVGLSMRRRSRVLRPQVA